MLRAIALAAVLSATPAVSAHAQDHPEVTTSLLAGGTWWSSYLGEHRAGIEDCVRRFVPDEASGVATVSGTVEGGRLARPLGWSAPTLPFERFRICIDALLEGAPPDAPLGEAVRIGIAVRAEPSLPSLDEALPVEGSTATGGAGLGAIGTSAAAREVSRPAYTSTWIESLDADAPEHARGILEARAAGPFTACVADVTTEAHVAFTVTLGDRGVVRAVRAGRSPLPLAARRCLERAIGEIQFLVPEGAAPGRVRFTLGVQHHPAETRRLAHARVIAEESRNEGPGELDLAVLARALTTRRASLSECHRGDDRAGRIEVTLTIAEDGTAGDARATGYDELVASCVARIASRMRLRVRPDGGIATVHVVVELTPVE